MANTHNILAEVVARIKCKPGWSFRLVTPEGDVFPKLVITVPGYDSAGATYTDAVLRASGRMEFLQRERVPIDDPNMLDAVRELHEAWDNHRRFAVNHFRPVPEAEYNEKSWRRWVFDQCLSLENHELGEWFRVEPVSQGRCDTTKTERFEYVACCCGTYEGNLGPCRTYEEGASGRCVYCEHGKECHDAVLPLRPFLPLHGPGEDPYTVHEFRLEIDARTTQDGSIREPYK